ncbi:hypothetical protein CLG96_07510 [Sphingomonas oleivorans]|uniref:DUF2214 domain-containing protein n=1 Tax=Sphingomonas oleivorans TaxID=1735121 RepID=A0A2T5G0A0_9SPHN|nr:hypothetical protein [Sphingomonas oleivorans]PTQ12368.1 hypothetical protein CLG96_07510 [Sphingomonas oleivorans]
MWDALAGAAAAIEASDFGHWARGSAYAYPVANLIHLLGLVLLVGGIGLLDLRLAGLFRTLPAEALSRILTPVAILGIMLLVGSSSVLFAADARSLILSGAFRWKIMLIAVALANAVAFRIFWQGCLADWDSRPPALGRAMAGGSVALWLAAAALGRLIAYA